jgi:hypothetical protein
MRAGFIALTIAICVAVVFAFPQPTAPVEPQQTVAQIDFDALHAQAAAALEALQQSHERHLASVDTATF